MSKILVTGATGTIGRQVTLALARAGADVRAGVRSLDKAKDLADAGAELVRLDWSDPASVGAAFAGVERLFLLTPFIENPTSMIEAALSSARDAGVEHIVRMSALGADASSDFALARKHGQGEEAVKQSGIGWTILQPTFFMDNFVNFGPAQTVKTEGRIYSGAGEGKVAWVSSADVGAVAAAILQDPAEHAGKTHVVTGGEAVTDAEVGVLLQDLLDTPVSVVPITPEQQRGAMQQQQTPEWMIDALLGLEDIKRNGWAAAVSPAVADVLGRPPETMRQFLPKVLDAFR